MSEGEMCPVLEHFAADISKRLGVYRGQVICPFQEYIGEPRNPCRFRFNSFELITSFYIFGSCTCEITPQKHTSAACEP